MHMATEAQINYRQLVFEEDSSTSKELFHAPSKSKQHNHMLFMETSFVAQTRGYFCGIASIASALHHLNQLVLLHNNNNNNRNKIRNQEYIYERYIKRNLEFKHGISMIQLIQICHNIISDYNLPYCASYVCVNDIVQLTKLFQNDIACYHTLFTKHNHHKMSSVPYMIITNYWRRMDAHKGGHFSPIINVSSDMQYIFIADVASHRIKPHWIKIKDFIPLMLHRVRSTNLPRGYIRIFHKDIAPKAPLSRLIIHKDHDIYIRRATEVDVLTLAAIQVAAWKETYRGIIDDTWLQSKSMSIKTKYKCWMKIFRDNYLISINEQPSKQHAVYKHVIVLCQNKRVFGYCTVGKTGRSSVKKTLPVLRNRNKNIKIDGELYTLYLSPNCPQRKGFGSCLFNAGYNLIRNGFDWNLMLQINECGNNNDDDTKKCVMAVWLLMENQIARNFYKKKGGVVINDNECAHFGGRIYRFGSMVFGS